MKQLIFCIIVLTSLFYGASADSCENQLFPKAPCCGISKPNSARIIGGTKVAKNEYPWMVYVNVLVPINATNNGTAGCGGSVINSQWVLSAAHCFENYFSIKMYVGTNNCSGKKCAPEARLITGKAFVHKGYEFGNPGSFNDIALIQLEEPLTFSDAIQPICLPTTVDQRLDDRNAVVAGWGIINNFGSSAPYLLQTTIQIWNSRRCDEFLLFNLNSSVQICAGGKSNTACNGDSGGPLFLKLLSSEENDENAPFYQVGIVSFGMEYCGFPYFPQVYTKVSSYLNWIKTIILENQKPILN